MTRYSRQRKARLSRERRLIMMRLCRGPRNSQRERHRLSHRYSAKIRWLELLGGAAPSTASVSTDLPTQSLSGAEIRGFVSPGVRISTCPVFWLGGSLRRDEPVPMSLDGDAGDRTLDRQLAHPVPRATQGAQSGCLRPVPRARPRPGKLRSCARMITATAQFSPFSRPPDPPATLRAPQTGVAAHASRGKLWSFAVADGVPSSTPSSPI